MVAAGVAVDIADAAPGGWPFSAARVLSGVALRGGAASLTADRAILRLSPLRPDALTLLLPGEVAARLPGLPALRARAQTWTVRLPATGAAAIDATALEVDLQQPDTEPPRRLTIALAHLQIAPTNAADTQFIGSAQSIALPIPPGETMPLGPRIASVAFDLTLRGSIPPPYLTAGALTAWRGDRGAIDLDRFALGYGPLGVSGNGRFDLDAALQPEGRAALHLVGQAETVAALAAARVISSHVAIAANAVLSLLAHTPPGGGVPQVDTGLVLEDGILSVAGFPLLRVPPVAWPGPS
jgi:hypothetical protein